MHRTFAYASLASVLMMAPSVVEAQQKVQPTQPPQSNKTNSTQQWGMQGGYYGGIGQTPWFSNPNIRQQLKLNDEQYNQLNKAYQQEWNRYQQGYNQLDKNLTDQQRADQVRKLQGQFYNSLSTDINKTITDPTARQRFNQMYWQYRGYDAFNDPMLQQKLNLTPEQRQKLEQYGMTWNKQMDTLGQQYGTDQQGAIKQFGQLQQQSGQQLNSLLTPDQRQTWQQMMGTPYQFPPTVYFQGAGKSSQAAPNPASGK